MEVTTFRAASLQEALDQVRKSLGPDASVLHTREVRRTRFGLFPQSMVEVEASVDTLATNRPQKEPVVQLESSSPAAKSLTSTQPTVQTAHNDTPTSEHLQPDSITRHVNEDAISDVLSELVGIGADPHLAKELLIDAAQRMEPAQRCDRLLLKASLNQSIAKRLRVSGSIDVKPNKQKIVSLVGPTGVGKTTSLAKIAAGFRFDLGCKVGLITLDTFRLGGVDQLLQYAELISAPLEVVSSPEQVTPALARLEECNLVLLDTAGRSPRDLEQLRLLGSFLEAAQPDSTHLVVSACSSKSHVADTIEKFSIVDPTSLIITKLDEAVDFAAWLPLLFGSKLPVSYMSTGQHVPQDIVVASPRRLARELLGNDLTLFSGKP